MKSLIKPFFKGKTAPYAYGGLTLILALTSAGVYLSFKFLEWYKAFYDTLEQKNFAAFKDNMFMFCILAAISVILSTVLKYFNQKYALKWREALTLDILSRWKDQKIEGYAQRIQEDCGKFSRLFEGLVIGGFSAILSVIIFTPILFTLSRQVFPNFWGALWLICLGYTIIGLAFSVYLGRRLPALEYANQKQEAKFRRALEYNKGGYKKLFQSVKENYSNLFGRYRVFNIFSNSYFQIGVILPYLIIGKFYFIGVITLGTLVQVSKTFNTINENMSYLIDSWLTITELQSVIMRLSEFNAVINKRL